MRTVRIPALALAGALVLAGCGRASSAATSGPGSDPSFRTDYGVTDSTITLGVLTDNSGPFKDLGLGLVAGHEIWADEVNKAGGVCGRQIKLEMRDHGYKPDTAAVQYADLEPKVVGFLELFGAPIVAALYRGLIDRQSSAVAVSYSSELLGNPYVLIAGATYDVEMINGLNYLMSKGMLKKGDTLGHIYIGGEYGNNGLLGSEYFAKKHGLRLKAVAVTAADADMTTIVSGLKSAGVQAIALSTSPAQTASVASAREALGMNVPLIGNNPAFVPALMDTPAAAALRKFFVIGSAVPFSSPVAKAKVIATRYQTRGSQLPNFGVQYGYALGEIWSQILQAACTAKDMTRAGIHTAVGRSTKVTTDKLVADLDFSSPGSPATRQVYIAVPDKMEAGGLRQVKPLFESADALAYKAPHQK